jgi:hypothetical protein
MNKCRNCAKPLLAASRRYCPYCGASVGRATPTWTGEAPASSPQRVNRKAYQPLIVVGVVVGILLVATVIFFVAHGNGQPSAAEGTPVGSGTDTTVGDPTATEQAVQGTAPDRFATDQPTVTTDVSDPATVVENYYAAVNQRDYQTAWQLGGVNLGKPYSTFVNGYATTVRDDVAVVDTSGNVVDVDLTARWSDNTTHHYQGSYTVSNGQIVSGSLHRTSG